MSPLAMESGSEYNSSLSGEECQSPATGIDKRGEKRPGADKTGRRKEKNRNAARKTRKKHTERADVLHEELQCLERSNMALDKEIAALKREFQHYTTVLEQHQPHCSLRTFSSSNLATTYPAPCPSTHLPAFTSPAEAPLHSRAPLSSQPGVPLQTSYSSLDAHHPSASACPTTATHLTPSIQPAAGLLAHSGAATAAALGSCSNLSSAPLWTSFSSLDAPLSAAASLAAPFPPAHTSLASSLLPTTTSVTVTDQTAKTALGHRTLPLTPSAPTDALSTWTSAAILPSSSPATMTTMPHSGLVNALLTEQVSLASFSPPNPLSLSAPSLLISAGPEKASVVPRSRVENTPQPSAGHVSPPPHHSSPPNGALPSYSRDSTLPSLLAPSIVPQTNWGSCSSTPIFPPSLSFTQLNRPTTSLLSLLTVPSPIIAPQTTSSNLIASPYAPGSISASHLLPSAAPSPGFPSLSPLSIPFPFAAADSSRDLLELLQECGDWVLEPASSGWDV